MEKNRNHRKGRGEEKERKETASGCGWMSGARRGAAAGLSWPCGVGNGYGGRCLEETKSRAGGAQPQSGEMMFGVGKEAQKEMEEFLAPKEVNTGMDVLPEVGFSAGGASLGSLDGLAAWKEK